MKWWIFVPPILAYFVCVAILFYALRDSSTREGIQIELTFKEAPPSFMSRDFFMTPPTRRGATSRAKLGTIDIEVHAGKKIIHFAVNGKTILHKNFTSSHLNKTNPATFAGLYLAVLQEFSGQLLKLEKFGTFQIGGEFELLKMLTELQTGRVVILASLYESFHLISNIFRKYLIREGSLAMRNIKAGERWSMVWTKGGRVWWEERVECRRDPCPFWQAGNLVINAQIPKSVEKRCETWPTDHSWTLRKRFCQNYEGYGNLCSCHRPLDLQLNHQKAFESLEDSFLLIVASDRPFTLSRCLKRLYKTRGFTPAQTIVSVDGRSTEVIELIQIFGLKYLIYNSSLLDISNRITHHYLFALKNAFALFPQATKGIILEEDLFVAPDFFSYFSQLSPILESDDSLYCISAWNDFGFMETSFNNDEVQRTDTMPGLGWMLTRTIFDELWPKWPTSQKKTDWDMWMRFNEQRKDRHCLIPEVSRTFHFGREGVHTSSQTQRLYYDDRKMPKEDNITLINLNRLTNSVYEEDLMQSINSSVHIDNSKHHPCDDNLIPRHQTNQSFVLWFKMINTKDTFTWNAVIECLGMWSPDIRGGFNKVWKLRLRGTQLYIIGWPLSKYSYLKPSNVNVLRKSTGVREETDPPVIIEKLIGTLDQ